MDRCSYTIPIVLFFVLFFQESKAQERHWSERVGLLVDGGVEYSARISLYDQFQTDSLSAESKKNLKPVERFPEIFQTAGGRFRLGLLNRSVIDFAFERPVGGSTNQERVFAFREQRIEGLSNYALGVDVAPVWNFLMPNSPWLIRTLLSARLRTQREMAHTFFRPKTTIYALGTAEEFSDARANDQTGFLEYDPNQRYVYDAFYRYQSFDIPLIYLVDQIEDTETGKKEADLFLSFRIGLSKWTVERPYFTRFPQWGNSVYAYLVDEETVALFGEVDLQYDFSSGHSLRSMGARLSGDVGVTSSLSNENFDLDGLYYPNSSESLEPQNYRGELDIYFTLSLISKQHFSLALRPTFSGHLYLSRVNNFARNFDRYYQRDILLFGSAALSFGF